MVREHALTIRRTARALTEPPSSVGRWARPCASVALSRRPRPVSDDPAIRQAIRALCHEDRHQRHGHRMIRAVFMRRTGRRIARKTVARIMREEGLARPKCRVRPRRPKRVARMAPSRPDQAWQIDMTSFQLSNLTPLFLVTVIDCCTREIVGWNLGRRCRASEWTAALRMALEGRGLTTKASCARLTLRSDNGAQPCSRRFGAYLAKAGVRGEYTGYNAPDDNAFVERVIRTLKEEEIWLNSYDTLAEAHGALEKYITHYNTERPHSALDYQTPRQVAARESTHLAA